MGVFDRFLNTVDTADGVPILDRSNPANWTRIGQTIAFGFVATVSLAYQTIIGGFVDAATDILSGVTEFVAGRDAPEWITNPDLREAASQVGLLDVLTTELTSIVGAVWAGSFSNVPGIFRLPAQVLVLLATFWVLAQGIEIAREVL